MRNSFFDLDEDSTIISVLTTRELSRESQATKSHPFLKVLLGCIVILIVYLLFKR